MPSYGTNPINEADRLAARQRFNILDSLPEQGFEDIVQLVSQICHTPMALVSFVDADRQWSKASVGLPGLETSREVSFCAHTISTGRDLTVSDASTNARFQTILWSSAIPLSGHTPVARSWIKTAMCYERCASSILFLMSFLLRKSPPLRRCLVRLCFFWKREKDPLTEQETPETRSAKAGASSLLRQSDYNCPVCRTCRFLGMGLCYGCGSPGVEAPNGFMDATGFRMRHDHLKEIFSECEETRSRVLEFVQQESFTLSQVAGCNRLHQAEGRLARWLLMAEDRTESPHLNFTQEYLGEMLGLQRTTVSSIAAGLHQAGQIDYVRGRLTVVDRRGLEDSACSCYPITKKLFQGLYQAPWT